MNLLLLSEPSFQKESDFGVKLGIVLEVVPYNDTGSTYLGFKAVTLVPFASKLIDPALLSADEMRWLNDYHYRTLQEVGTELKKQSKMRGFYWLMENSKEIRAASSQSKNIPSLLLSLSLVYILFYCT